MSWVYEDTRSPLQKFATNVLKNGQLPKHVAIIMDGNRRWARARGLNSIEGHRAGFDKSLEVARWCIEAGVEEITLYGFSLENFNREKESVSELMGFIETHCFPTMMNKNKGANEDGWGLRMLTKADRLPQKIRPWYLRVMSESKAVNKKLLNVAFVYTSRVHMTGAFKEIEKGLKAATIFPQDVSEGLVDQLLRIDPSRPVDLLIRTGGDTRLSDFMLWESTHAHIQFVNTPWPSFSCWEFLKACFEYRLTRETVPRTVSLINEESRERVEKFVKEFRASKWETITNGSAQLGEVN